MIDTGCFMLVGLLLFASCAPSPAALRGYNDQLQGMAEPASEELTNLCKLPDSPAAVSPAPPRDAEWGERYFHILDPDGHELSFARPLAINGK